MYILDVFAAYVFWKESDSLKWVGSRIGRVAGDEIDFTD